MVAVKDERGLEALVASLFFAREDADVERPLSPNDAVVPAMSMSE
jgi:hypothetical protein